MKKLWLVLAALVITAGCGSSSKPVPAPQGRPLDPQGNWLFTLTDSRETWSFAGQLYELNPPTVTAPNGLSAFGSCNAGNGQSNTLVLSSPAQVTGTASITFNFVSAPDATAPVSYTLVGTIAADQQHVTGTYSGTNTFCNLATPSGTFAAQLIPNVTGNWSGAAQGVSVSAGITENTDQTSASMGLVTGSMTISGSPCMLSGTYSLQSSSEHAAETVIIDVTDTNNVALSGIFTVDPSTPNAATGNVFYAGGPCDGQGFPFSLTRQ